MPTNSTEPELDLHGVSCPMAFVKARLHLDKLLPGNVTKILFDDTPANEPLIRSIEALGHTILHVTKAPAAQPPHPSSASSAGRPPSDTLQLMAIAVQVKK